MNPMDGDKTPYTRLRVLHNPDRLSLRVADLQRRVVSLRGLRLCKYCYRTRIETKVRETIYQRWDPGAQRARLLMLGLHCGRLPTTQPYPITQICNTLYSRRARSTTGISYIARGQGGPSSESGVYQESAHIDANLYRAFACQPRL